jgi:hypothetical protein
VLFPRPLIPREFEEEDLAAETAIIIDIRKRDRNPFRGIAAAHPWKAL